MPLASLANILFRKQITGVITQPSIYSNCLFFAMSWVTELFQRSMNMTIDCHYTMAWLPASLLKTHRGLSTCATTMRIWFVYERRCYATLVIIRYGLATLNSNNSVVYGLKHKVWVLVFLVRTSRTFWDQNWADLVKFSVLKQNRIVYSNSMQETLLSISSNGLGNKTVISCLLVVQSNYYPSVPWTTWCTIACAIVHQVVHGTSR